jgi:hypothetical protein
MARILLHYNISNDSLRTRFQNAITAADFGPQFHEATASVYWAEFSPNDETVKALVKRLQDALTKSADDDSDVPKGTRVYLEHPGATSGHVTIISTKVHSS